MTRSIQIRPVTQPVEQAAKFNLEIGRDRVQAGQAAADANRDRAGEAKGLDGAQHTDGAGAAAKTASVNGAYTGFGAGAPAASPVQQEMLDYATPKLADPSILQPSRALPLLRTLLRDVLPALNSNPDAQQLAAAVLDSEINRQRDVSDRLHQGLPA